MPLSESSFLELALRELQESGALPQAEARRVSTALKNDQRDQQLLALRAGLKALPPAAQQDALKHFPGPLGAMAAASVHMSEEAIVQAAEAVAPLSSGGEVGTEEIVRLQATLKAMPPAAKKAAAAALPKMQGAMLVAVSEMDANDVSAAMTIMQPQRDDAPPPAGALVLGDAVVSEEALGAAHRLLKNLPVETRAELAEQLPAAARPLVGLAADLDAEEFKEAVQTAAAAVQADADEDDGGGHGGSRGGGAPAGAHDLAARGKLLAGGAAVVLRGVARAWRRWVARVGIGDPRALGSAAALVAVAGGLLAAPLHLLTLRLASLVVSLAACLAGAACFVLEAELAALHSAAPLVLRAAPALARGAAPRAQAYAATALLLFVALLGVLGAEVGGFVCLPLLLAAAANLLGATAATPALAELRASLGSAEAVRRCFDSADDDARGGLPRQHLARLWEDVEGRGGLGQGATTTSPMTLHAMAVALTPLGGHVVTEKSMLVWWRRGVREQGRAFAFSARFRQKRRDVDDAAAHQHAHAHAHAHAQAQAQAHEEGAALATPAAQLSEYDLLPCGAAESGAHTDEAATAALLAQGGMPSSSPSPSSFATDDATDVLEARARRLAAALEAWARQRRHVQRAAVALAAGETLLLVAALFGCGGALLHGEWATAAVAAAVCAVAAALLSVELAQAPPPVGPQARRAGLLLLREYLVLSLSLPRGLLLLLGACLVAAASATPPPPPLSLLLIAAAAAAAFAAYEGAATVGALATLLGRVPTAAAARAALVPDEFTATATTAATVSKLMAAGGGGGGGGGGGAAAGGFSLCDLMVALDHDRDGRVGPADVAAWFGQEEGEDEEDDDEAYAA